MTTQSLHRKNHVGFNSRALHIKPWLILILCLFFAADALPKHRSTDPAPPQNSKRAKAVGQKSQGTRGSAKTNPPASSRSVNGSNSTVPNDGVGNSGGGVKHGAKVTEETIGTKKNGVIRIGVVLPKVSSGGETQSEANLEKAFRAAVIQTLRGPGVEAVPLEYQVVVHAASEAKQKGCDYILFTRFEKKKKGGGSLLGKVTGIASSVGQSDLPGREQKATNVKKSASSGATIGSGVDNVFKVGDQAVLNYELFTAGGLKPIYKDKLEEKLEKEGENVVSTLLLKAANEFLPKIIK